MQSHIAKTEIVDHVKKDQERKRRERLARINEIDEERKRREKLARIKEIQAQGETTTSASWYFLAWNLCVSTMVGIQEVFRTLARENPIFALIYPDHPGTKEILGAIGFSTWSMALKVVSPVALAFSWINTAVAFKQLWQKENKSVWDYTNAFFSLASSVAWSVLLGLGAAGAGAAVAGALASVPYLIPAVFGVYAFYGLAKCAKNCYLAFKAWQEGKTDECKAYLWKSGKQLISVVTNTLALVTSLFLGVKMQEAAQLIQDNFAAGKEAINACFDKAASLLYVLGASAGIGIVMNTTQMNKETLNTLLHPIDAARKAWYASKANPVLILKTFVNAPIRLPLRIVSFLIVGPVQGLAKLVSKGISRLFNKDDSPSNKAPTPIAKSVDGYIPRTEATSTLGPVSQPESKILVSSAATEVVNPVIHTPVSEEKRLGSQSLRFEEKIAVTQTSPSVATSSQQLSSTGQLTARFVSSNECLTPEHVYQKIQIKLKKMHKSFPDMKHAPDSIVAKLFQLEELSKFIKGESKYRSVEQIERQAKLISRHGLYRSYFRMRGSEVKELTEEVRKLAAPVELAEETRKLAAPAA